MNRWDLREDRRRHGLSMRAVARAAGMSPPAVSAYEREITPPDARTAACLRAVVAAGSTSPIHRHILLTVPATAAALRSGLQADWSTADLLRLVREMRSNWDEVSGPVDVAAFFAEPPTTGDQRWDAMLAACVDDLAQRREIAPPTWCRGHVLPTVWFVGSGPHLQAYAYVHSPFPFKVRGVMIDPRDLGID